LVDKNKFEVSNKKKETKVIQLKNAQQWLDQRYPIKNTIPSKRRNRVEQLDVSNKELEGSLDLTDFINLKKLYCSDNKLTSLKLSNLTKLETIFCSNNQLTNLEINGLNNLENLDGKINQLGDISSLLSELNPIKLKILDLKDNNFSENNLTPLSKFINLEYLELSNNGSQQDDNSFYLINLEPLQLLNKLEKLHIKDSSSNREICYSSNKKDGLVVEQITKYVGRHKQLSSPLD